MNLQTLDLLVRNIEHNGANAQVDMFFEEAAELQKELLKNRRGRKNKRYIAEEIADVQIVLAQLQIIFDCEMMVKRFVNEKLQRLKERLDMEEAEVGHE